jgi:uncharacterized membrane protein
MSDNFDRFLAEALAPKPRDPDREFVARVQAHIRLEDYLRGQRRSAFRRLAVESLGLLFVAAGLIWLGRAEPVAGFFADSPGVALAGLLCGFGLLVALFSSQTSETSRSQVEFQPISNI